MMIDKLGYYQPPLAYGLIQLILISEEEILNYSFVPC